MERAFVTAVLADAVLLPPHQIGGNYRDVLLYALRQRNEGVCTRHGYVMPGSIQLQSVSPGRVQTAMLNGSSRFDVTYVARVCDPGVGTRLRARVVNSNRFGLLAHAGVLAADGTFTPVVEAIVAKQTDALPTVPGAITDLEGVRVGDEVTVHVLGKRSQLRAQTISVVAVVVDDDGAGGPDGVDASPSPSSTRDMSPSLAAPKPPPGALPMRRLTAAVGTAAAGAAIGGGVGGIGGIGGIGGAEEDDDSDVPAEDGAADDDDDEPAAVAAARVADDGARLIMARAVNDDDEEAEAAGDVEEEDDEQDEDGDDDMAPDEDDA